MCKKLIVAGSLLALIGCSNGPVCPESNQITVNLIANQSLNELALYYTGYPFNLDSWAAQYRKIDMPMEVTWEINDSTLLIQQVGSTLNLPLHVGDTVRCSWRQVEHIFVSGQNYGLEYVTDSMLVINEPEIDLNLIWLFETHSNSQD